MVIDPLVSAECAATGLALYREHGGDRPVTAVIYTHSHMDHFGVLGVVNIGTDVPIVAPEHFLEHAVSENVYAGGAMPHPTIRTDPANLVITLTRPQLLAMLGGAGTDGVQFDGDPKTFTSIAALTDQPDPAFPIVTP